MLSKPLGSPDDSSSPREKPETLDSSVRATVGKLILRAIPVLRIYLRETKLVFCLFSVPQTSLTSLNKRISRGSVIVWGVSLIQMCSLCAGVSGFVCSTALYWMKLPDFLCFCFCRCLASIVPGCEQSQTLLFLPSKINTLCSP